jgi:hypothetical protein
MTKFLRFLSLGLLLAPACPCSATTHIFVLNKEGIWVGSDSLGYRKGVERAFCKVAASHKRLILNTGSFVDVDKLVRDENELPEMSFLAMQDALAALLKKSVLLDKDYLVKPVSGDPVSGGEIILLQFVDGQPRAEAMVISPLGDEWRRWFKLVDGQPHGVGIPQLVDSFNLSAKEGSSGAAEVAKNPKVEILRMLQAEADALPGFSGPPYSVLLLKPDGTISDFSEKPVCAVPPKAN